MILIGYSLKNYSLNDIVGVYLISSFLLFLISFTNIINFLKKNIPTEIVMGMVSAIFLIEHLMHLKKIKTSNTN